MTEQELVKQWLQPGAIVPVDANTTRILITALRERLAQPEQQHSEQWWKHEVSNAWAEGYEKGRVMCGCGDQIMPDDGAECGNCVTARNAVKPQPVAQVHVVEDYYPHVIWAEGINAVCFDQEYLYITPPQREWQGLTDEEVKAAWSQLWYDLGNGKFAASDDPARHTTIMFAKEIEAKLKEKNHAI